MIDDDPFYIGNLILKFLISIVFVSIIFFLISVIPITAPENEITKINIASLEMHDTIDGSFALGSGSISGVPKYFMYRIQPDGGYALMNVDMESTILYTDEEVSPYVNQTKRCSKSILQTPICNDPTYNIHVPKNTIKQTYNGMVNWE